MPTTHSLENPKHHHNEAIQFFGSELMLLKEAIPKITDDRISKTATLLISGGQTGETFLQRKPPGVCAKRLIDSFYI